MELKIRNFNKIKSADIQLNGLTVIVGENDSGKSTVGRVLFSAIKALVNTKASNDKKRDDLLRKHVQSFYRRLTSVGIHFSIAARKNESDFPRNIAEFISEINDSSSVEEYIKQKEIAVDQLMTTPRVKSLMKDDLYRISICMTETNNRAAKLYTEFQYLLESEFLNQFSGREDDQIFIDILAENKQTSYFRFTSNGKAAEARCEDEESLEDITYVESPLYLHILDSLMFAGTYREVDKKRRSIVPMIPYHIKDFAQKMNSSRSYFSQQSLFNDNSIQTNEIIGGSFSYDENRRSVIFRKKEMSILPINVASGIKSFGVLQMLLDGEYIDANRLLIWDEPENHLHPEWQVEFAKVLVQMYKSGKPIIITTHSPYFLQAIRYFSAKEKAEDFVTYYMAQPTEDGFVEMEDVTNDLNKVFKKLAAPLTGVMNIDAARQGIDL
jgi:predicted ATPase